MINLMNLTIKTIKIPVCLVQIKTVDTLHIDGQRFSYTSGVIIKVIQLYAGKKKRKKTAKFTTYNNVSVISSLVDLKFVAMC